jgi:hypothetical protein
LLYLDVNRSKAYRLNLIAGCCSFLTHLDASSARVETLLPLKFGECFLFHKTKITILFKVKEGEAFNHRNILRYFED